MKRTASILTLMPLSLSLSTACVIQGSDDWESPAPVETPTPRDGWSTPQPDPTATPVVADPTPDASTPTPVPVDDVYDPDAIIVTVAGSGDPGTAASDSTTVSYGESGYEMTLGSNTGSYGGDGGPATSAQLAWPTGVSIDTDGAILIADQYNGVARRVNPAGVIHTSALAFTYPLEDGDDWYYMYGPGGIEVTAQGEQYIVDTWSCTVLKVDAAGVPRTVAGVPFACEEYGGFGDGGPALEAGLWYPTGIAVDSQGTLYIAEFYAGVIRVVYPDGFIDTLAGLGNSRVTTTPIDAYDSRLGLPGGIAVGPDDSLYITDNFYHQIDKITPDGDIVRIAGTGVPGFSGDGGPALEAMLSFPTGLRLHPSGTLMFTDTYNHRVRAIDPDGIVRTVAGIGGSSFSAYQIGGFSGDGGPAHRAALSQPYALDFDAVGNLYIADAMNNRIRKVTFSGN